MLILVSLLMLPDLYGQTKAKKFFVTGIVTDANKNPVAGAMILVDSKYTSKVTDNKGSFKIKVKPDAELISVVTPDLGIGEAMIDGETLLNISLRAGVPAPQSGNKNEAGTEENVNIGYGSINKKNLTTPVNRLDVRDSRYASYTNMYELLKGAVPGVQVSGTRITIQGINSFNLSTEPLFIVDGMQVGSIADVQPIQVESVEVLKGAAAAIYGSRGANGVIMIKLKGAPELKK